MTTSPRRHDIDSLRVIAIGLLLLYHVAIGFQSWGIMVGFISHAPAVEWIWPPMTLINIWRIPLLFFVSGMGVCFAIQRRTAGQLIIERSRRILLPFVFGIFCIVPLHMFILQRYYQWDTSYSPGPAHLWFLGNIFVYTIGLLPLFVLLQKKADSAVANTIKWVIASPLGWLIVLTVFAAEAWIVKPYPYELYAMTTHGFVLGLLAFLCGYLFVYSGAPFWNRLCRWRWLFLATSVALFTYRTWTAPAPAPLYWLSIESNVWVFAALAFSYRYLNRPSAAFSYLSQAAYPIYIIHMVFLYLASALLFPLDMNIPLKVALVLALTFGGCLAGYEFAIRRIRWVRPLFGLKSLKPKTPKPLRASA